MQSGSRTENRSTMASRPWTPAGKNSIAVLSPRLQKQLFAGPRRRAVSGLAPKFCAWFARGQLSPNNHPSAAPRSDPVSIGVPAVVKFLHDRRWRPYWDAATDEVTLVVGNHHY